MDNKKKSVLVIDDDTILLDLVKEFLKNEYDVSVSSNVPKAIFKLKNEKFDVVISDFNLPRVNGEELAKELFQIKLQKPLEYEDTKMIMMSDPYYLNKLSDSIKEGVHFLSKPFNRQDLIDKISSLTNEDADEGLVQKLNAKANDVLFSSEQSFPGVIILKKGVMLLKYKDFSVRSLKEGECFGDVEAFTGEKVNCEVSALTDLEYYLVPVSHIREQVEKQSSFFRIILRNLIKTKSNMKI